MIITLGMYVNIENKCKHNLLKIERYNFTQKHILQQHLEVTIVCINITIIYYLEIFIKALAPYIWIKNLLKGAINMKQVNTYYTYKLNQ